ncbi:hypothetical protein [Streptomyces sp. NPDC020489]|uniref:hypothetical protein n=1 Tax=Streptomyces sp. NPDC020489 TaxID=3365077 RepID=UPI0037AB892C
MSLRPYPSQARALRQVMRRHRNDVPGQLLRAGQTGGRTAGERLRAGFAALPSAGDYVISTRRAPQN